MKITKPELKNHAICLENFLILLFKYKQLFFVLIWILNNLKDKWADNYIYRNLRDFTHEIFLIVSRCNHKKLYYNKTFFKLFIASISFLCLTQNLNNFIFLNLDISCFQLYGNNNLETYLIVWGLFSKKMYSFPFLFERKLMSTNSLKNKSELGSYLAGLIESDGFIIVLKDNTNTPTIKIVFNIKDKPLADCLMETLGSGSIQPASDNSVLYVVRSKSGIVKIINLINGEFKTPKIEALHKLIDWINNNPNYNNSKVINKMPLNVIPLVENSLFSGFSEGDGSFLIRVTEGVKYNNITVTYTISQGNINESVLETYKPIMLKIAQLCGSNVEEKNLSVEKNGLNSFMWRVRTTNKKGVLAVIQYFNKFPLWSSKYLDYLNWEQAYNIIINKKHTKPEGLFEIKQLKNTMNNKFI
uniref:Homing endonuclease LAGLIDADG domain-containing protein n=1 Tax=Arthrobotrys musiformis TaxID=47236 RepID=A0A482EAW0_9PEZI|nr:hypothetical protein [Arthrobotrys musiformis]QBM31466.1 hypothetical protein [Arthrobotrys musiformis]QBM31619.1 hypothetical protein [Arthrobotrys musiformis]